MSLVGHNLDLCREGPRYWSMREREKKSYFEISRRAVETEARLALKPFRSRRSRSRDWRWKAKLVDLIWQEEKKIWPGVGGHPCICARAMVRAESVFLLLQGKQRTRADGQKC